MLGDEIGEIVMTLHARDGDEIERSCDAVDFGDPWYVEKPLRERLHKSRRNRQHDERGDHERARLEIEVLGFEAEVRFHVVKGFGLHERATHELLALRRQMRRSRDIENDLGDAVAAGRRLR